MISKKYVTIIISVLLLIAAAVLAVSQIFVGGDIGSKGIPYSIGPSSPPHVTPPTTPPPSN